MQIQIDIPGKKVILDGGLSVRLAGPHESWSEFQLNEYRHMNGVYVIHHDNRIRYVGETHGPTMTFGDRLRREFNYSAAQGKGLYPKLAKLTVSRDIKVVFYAPKSLAGLFRGTGLNISEIGMIRIAEQAFIAAYDPDFQKANPYPVPD